MPTLLKDIPKSELPRERLLVNGPESLSNEELLSILLRTGVRGNSVNDLSRQILSKIDSINDLKYMDIATLKSIRGLKDAKSVTVLAALELGKRVYDREVMKKRPRVMCPVDIYRYFAKYILDEKQENFMVVFLDNANRYITHKILFKGTLNSSLVSHREVFKMALLNDAAAIILMHNHPSGSVQPSLADDKTTALLVEVGNTMGIQVIDHMIVGGNEYYSYQEEGRYARV